MKILTVVGARPQFVKASVVSRALSKRGIDETVVHTGQHYDENMSGVFFEELGMRRPEHRLEVNGGLHGEMTGRIMIALEPLVLSERPDVLLVYGDTNSTLAGALVAAKIHVPVAHIEAGLRSFNRTMPEEINRIATDHLSTHLFCPTTTSVENLRNEGITRNVVQVGDVMFDVALAARPRAAQLTSVLADLEVQAGAYVLATVHRQENADDAARLRRIMTALTQVSAKIPVVMPLHPRTRKRLVEYGIDTISSSRLRLVDPFSYLEMSLLEQQAALIVTDSGGVQKEAYFYQVPCVTLRSETEWSELVDLGWNSLVRVEQDDISGIVLSSMGKKGRTDAHPYGMGNAAELIADELARTFL